jgi:hypothetical protein
VPCSFFEAEPLVASGVASGFDGVEAAGWAVACSFVIALLGFSSLTFDLQ